MAAALVAAGDMEGAVQAYVSALQYNPVSIFKDVMESPNDNATFHLKRVFCSQTGGSWNVISIPIPYITRSIVLKL